jgi:hypothetical protein
MSRIACRHEMEIPGAESYLFGPTPFEEFNVHEVDSHLINVYQALGSLS